MKENKLVFALNRKGQEIKASGIATTEFKDGRRFETIKNIFVCDNYKEIHKIIKVRT